MIHPNDIARIEAWAASRYPHLRDDGAEILVRSRGSEVVIVERWTQHGVERNRQIIRLRRVRKTGLWALHWAVEGGRWLGERPVDASLEELLDSIELERLPA